MPILIVTTLEDESANTADLAIETNDGDGLSLREAIAIANANPDKDAIQFASSLIQGTIQLSNVLGQLEVSTSLTISGDINTDGVPDITIDGSNETRVLAIRGDESSVILENLTITNGNLEEERQDGAGIWAGPGTQLILTGVNVTDNQSADYSRGTGIYSAGDVTITDSVISSNNGDYIGGGNICTG